MAFAGSTPSVHNKFCAHAGIHNLGGIESALLTRSGGSTVHVPVKDGLLLVGREVLFPKVQIRAGDHFLVLPKVEMKSWQTAKEISQMLYQLALMAGVVGRLF